MENIQILKEIVVQILGFAVVFLILRKLAWKNLLGSIDARRARIEQEFASIDENKKKLEVLEAEYRRKLETIEEAARAKILEAANVGTGLAKEIQEKARLDAQKMIDRAKAEIDQEIAKARLSLRDQIVTLSGAMTEKVLKEKIDAKEHERLVDKFIGELERVG